MVLCILFLFNVHDRGSLVAAFLWGIVVAVSRVGLGRHFLTDVFGGLAFGALEFWLASLVLHFLATTPQLFGLADFFPYLFM